MIPMPPRLTQPGNFNEWLRKLWAVVAGSRPKAGLNVRIEETPDGSVIHAEPKFAGTTYPLLICDQTTMPPTRKILDVFAAGAPRDEDDA